MSINDNVYLDGFGGIELGDDSGIAVGSVLISEDHEISNPEVLIKGIETLAQKDISLKGRLLVSENAHVVLDYHKKEDQLREESLGKDKLGTTIRGIGP